MKFLARLALFALSTLLAATAAPLVKTGERVAFLGDSITAAGNGTAGYLRMTARGLATAGIDIVLLPAGVSGNKSDQMLARLEKDVLAKKPDWLAVNCGVNDVWHKLPGGLDAYKANLTAIVDRAQAANIKVLLMTFTPIYEDIDNHFNKTASAYNAFLRDLAREKNCVLADLDSDFRAAHAAVGPRFNKEHNRFTTDGVHPNTLGHAMMAAGVLRAFGLDEAQLATAHASLDAEPGLVRPAGRASLTLADYKRLAALAEKQKRPLSEILDELTARAVADYLAAARP